MSVFFDRLPVFYINLDEHQDRKKYIEYHFQENKIENYFRVPGINGKEVENKSNLSDSENGCTLSHLKALSLFLETDYNFALICEDDVDLSNSENIDFSFYETLNTHNEEYYCLQLAVIAREEMPVNFLIHRRVFWDFSTAAYIVNRAYASKLIDLYKDDLTFNNFLSRNIYDPRGGIIQSRPVADELVYNSCNTLSLPIFCFKDFEPFVSTTDENKNQVKKSIDQFNYYWSNNKKIDLTIFSV